MLTTEQITQLRGSAGLSPTPVSSDANSIIAKRKLALGITAEAPVETAKSPLTPLGQKTADFYGGTFDKAKKGIVDSSKAIYDRAGKIIDQTIQYGKEDANKPIPDKIAGLIQTIAHGVVDAGAGGAGDIMINMIKPFLPQDVKDNIKGKIADASTAIQTALKEPADGRDLLHNEQFRNMLGHVSEVAKDNPRLAQSIVDGFNAVALTGGGAAEVPVKTAIKTGTEALVEGVNATRNAAGELISNVSSKAAPVIDSAASTVSDTAKSIKNKVAPTPTIDGLVGKVAQGKPEDIPSFTRGLGNLDTSQVSTYKDLGKIADDTISSTAKQQDVALSMEKTPLKIQQLAAKVGEQGGAKNYVIDAVNQLKDYYTKINDVAGLQKIKTYVQKIDPLKGDGLTVQELNDLARLHGRELNAYNANGELASGLTKQAVENTRQGLKDTVVQNIKDPTAKEVFKAADAKMSDLYTVSDLSNKMEIKVNALEQRLQKPNILQKIGGIVGRATRITGVGDFASKLLGIDKVPGSATLNAVELEAKLSKNLAKIEKALNEKKDSDFIKDISDMVKNP